MKPTDLSLKWLGVFQAVAETGSIQEAANRLGVSVSTVSHHLSCLETAIGTALLDRQKRPMKLTREGAILVRRVDGALTLLRKGISDIWSDDLGVMVPYLRVASIDDLDGGVNPGLATELAQAMPSCELSFLSRPSHEIFNLLDSEEVDLGIATASEIRSQNLLETPLLRDPFLLVAPRAATAEPGAYLDGESGLPFVRYSKKQLIGRRVDMQLRRLRRALASQMAFETTPAILSLVAEGRAWTVTTALNYASAPLLHDRIAAMPFPGAGFQRQISLFRRDDLHPALFTRVEARIRALLQGLVIDPIHRQEPWLTPDFHLLAS